MLALLLAFGCLVLQRFLVLVGLGVRLDMCFFQVRARLHLCNVDLGGRLVLDALGLEVVLQLLNLLLARRLQLRLVSFQARLKLGVMLGAG